MIPDTVEFWYPAISYIIPSYIVTPYGGKLIWDRRYSSWSYPDGSHIGTVPRNSVSLRKKSQ